jgi:hypothetical protein
MNANDKTFAASAGHVVFPRSPEDLRNRSICPACLNPLAGPVCRICHLDLGNPASGELAAASSRAADELDERLALIGMIRRQSAQAAQAAQVIVPSVASPVAEPARPEEVAQRPSRRVEAPSPVPPFSLVIDPSASGSVRATPADRAGRSSVQIILLVVGVGLLSIAAIFFLVYAFITYGILVRSAIIAAITVAAFIVASLLRRRRLHSTAEGIAVFAAVLVYLDAFAVRANDLFQSRSSDSLLYWGITLVAASAVLLAWHRLSKLRVPSVVGWAALAPGLGLTTGGIATGLDGATRAFLVFTVISVAGLAHPLIPRVVRASDRAIAERATVLISTALALFVALILAFEVAPRSDAAPAIAVAIVAAIALAHVLVATRTSEPDQWLIAPASIIAGFGTIAATLGGTTIAGRHSDFASLLFWPAVIAAPIALVIDVLAGRAKGALLTSVGRISRVAALIVAGLSVIAPILLAAGASLLTALSGVVSPWHRTPFESLGLDRPLETLSIEALAAVGAFAALLWIGTRLAMARLELLAGAGALIVVLAVPLLDAWATATMVWLGLGIAATATLVIARGRIATVRGMRPVLIGVVIAATGLGYLTSWSSTDTWAYGTVAALIVAIGARFAVTAALATLRAGLLAPAIVVLFIGSAALVRQLAGNPPSGVATSLDGLHIVGAVATMLVVLAMTLRGLSAPDRRVMFWLPLAVAVLCALGTRFALTAASSVDGLLFPEPVASVVFSIALTAALVVALVVRQTHAFVGERIAASILLAPAVTWILDSVVRLTGASDFIVSLVPFSAALLVAACALGIAILRPGTTPRWAAESGVVVVGFAALVLVLGPHPLSLWLALLLLGVTTLLLAISADGLFGSDSPRRYLGWLALAFATAGLWSRLGGDNVVALEPYVLPLAALLLAIAYLIGRSSRATVAPLIALSGMLVGILPLALVGATGSVLRPVLVGLVSVALLGAGVSVRGNRWRAYLDAAAIAGALGIAVVGIGRTIADFISLGTSSLLPDAWLAITFAVLLAGAYAAASAHGLPSDHVRSIVAEATVVLGMIAILGIESFAVWSGANEWPRGFVGIVLFGALYIVAFWARRAPLTSVVGWIAIACALILAVVGVSGGAIDPVEWASVPIALALLVVGVLRLADTPSARSWPQLASGILVLLVPSLFATITDRPVWRLVALGVVAVSLLVIGAVRGLQAPFLLGAIVALVHGIGTFEAQIRAVYEAVPWWLWLGVGGVVLILLAARYEKRIANVKHVAMRLAALR